ARGASRDLCPAHTGVFQEMVKSECHCINGTERVGFMQHREQQLHFDSDVGLFVGDTPYGEKQAQYWNSHAERLGYKRPLADRLCRHNYEIVAPLLADR
ncbi:HB2L protein, partial [Myiagra hebetior]|nr:HB2L protein [Myiagra hebetior]